MNAQQPRHRNSHPDDQLLFSGQQLVNLQQAEYELCWLLNRGYARNSAITLVSDHHQLRQRQRLAIARAACSDLSLSNRKNKSIKLEQIKDQSLIIDGFNLIITLEVAMANALLLRCRDGCIRDLASLHGTYRMVAGTPEVIYCIGQTLANYGAKEILWLFDQPVSNSGRLAQLVANIANSQGWNWQTRLHKNPDRVIAESKRIAITSDSAILDVVSQWLNLPAYLIEHQFQTTLLVDLS